MARREDVPVAQVSFGRSSRDKLSLYGWPSAEMGVPTVELSMAIEGCGRFMSPETAEQLADALKLAARAARGEVSPTALDGFLARADDGKNQNAPPLPGGVQKGGVPRFGKSP